MKPNAKSFLMAAAAAVALASGGAASAATFVTVSAPAPDGSLSWTFGNTGGIASGAFTDIFNFTLPSTGTLNASITSTFTKASNELKFTLVTVAGSNLVLYDAGKTHNGFTPIDLSVFGGATQIVVKGVSPGVSGSYSGNLSFSPNAVPEPTTWALMITGFGGAGAMLRRRRREGAALA